MLAPQPTPHTATPTETASGAPGIAASLNGIAAKGTAPTKNPDPVTSRTPKPLSASTLNHNSLVAAAAAPATAKPTDLVSALLSVFGLSPQPSVANGPAAPAPLQVVFDAVGLIGRDIEQIAATVAQIATIAVADVAQIATLEETELARILTAADTQILGGGGATFGLQPGLYGNPEKNAKYWEAQSSKNCTLMAVAMVIGQLTGNMPTEKQIVTEAMNTLSVTDPGEPMYLGLKSTVGVSNYDAVKLLENHGFTVTHTSYDKNGVAGRYQLTQVTTALTQSKAVMVNLDSTTIWRAVTGEEPPADVPPIPPEGDHMVVVIGVDIDADPSKSVVYLSDSGWPDKNENGKPVGQNMEVPLDAFMNAWESTGFETITAVK